MPKQQVAYHDGLELYNARYSEFDENGGMTITLTFKKKQPKLIVEYKAFIYRDGSGNLCKGVINKAQTYVKDPEAHKDFVQWVDTEWQREEV